MCVNVIAMEMKAGVFIQKQIQLKNDFDSKAIFGSYVNFYDDAVA